MTQLGAVPGEFHIPVAASLQPGRIRTLKSGDAFGVFDADGDVPGTPGSTDGLYFRDTRHLSKLVLLVGGRRPVLLSSTLGDDNAELTCDLANPDLYADGHGDRRIVLEQDVLHLRRSRLLWNAALHERLSVPGGGGAAVTSGTPSASMHSSASAASAASLTRLPSASNSRKHSRTAALSSTTRKVVLIGNCSIQSVQPD